MSGIHCDVHVPLARSNLHIYSETTILSIIYCKNVKCLLITYVNKGNLCFLMLRYDIRSENIKCLWVLPMYTF